MMAKKTAARERTRSRPLTLAALEEYGALAGFVAPRGEFDPQGPWKHPYRLWLVASGGLAPKPADVHYRGFMEIRREPLPEGKGIALRVHQSILQQTPGVHETSVRMTCAADALVQPRRWQLSHSVRDAGLRPIPQAQLRQRGVVSEGPVGRIPVGRIPVDEVTVRIEHDDHVTTFRAPVPLSTNWSLFDAVQRMPRREAPPREFAMLQECDLLKPAQQITYRGAGEHTLGGNTVGLHHWQQVGRGILPYNYYTDDQGRLLLALAGLRAYVFDPGVADLHKKCLLAILRKARQ